MIDKKNIFEHANTYLDKELIENIVNSAVIRIEKIVSKGHVSPDGFWFDQDENEFVILLQGEAALEFEDNNIVYLKKSDYIVIEKHKKHRIIYTSKNTLTVWLAVFYK
jgi:cupin 2 domain-containing protein